MPIDISTIAMLIGIIAGGIFYMDGWGPTPGKKELSASKRYQALATVVGGGIISPILDKYFFAADKFPFFRGYLLGLTIGWGIFFVSMLVLFVMWKNTRNLRSTGLMFSLGQISFSILEVVAFGITDNPQLEREQERQRSVDELKKQQEILALQEKWKRENPSKFVEVEEQGIKREKQSLELKMEQLQNLKEGLNTAAIQPEQEAQHLLDFKDKMIKTLNSEMDLARSRYDKDHERSARVVEQYELQLERQRGLRMELEKALQRFRNQTITKNDFSRIVSYQKIAQYELGGLVLGQFAVGQRMIKIYQGDIADLIVDVIVSSDDNYLTMGGGVSARILEAAGPSISAEAKRLVPLKLGDVAETKAGNLPAKKIFHAVTIDRNAGMGPNEHTIRTIVQTCVRRATEQRFYSLALPLIGTGVGNFPAAVALEIEVSELIETFKNLDSTLSEIFVVIYGWVAKSIDVEGVIDRIKHLNQVS